MLLKQNLNILVSQIKGLIFSKKKEYKLPFGDLKDLIYNLIISQK